MRKFLCFIGLHAWTYTGEMSRKCDHCPRQEVADGDLDFQAIFWRSTAPTDWISVARVLLAIALAGAFALVLYDSIKNPAPAHSQRQA